jgi:hypothetical protein
MRGPLFPGPGLGTRGSGLAGPRLPRRSQNESVRRWRLLGAPACGFLPNGLASTSRRCNGSAALSRPSSPVSKEAVGRAAAGAAAPWAAPPPFRTDLPPLYSPGPCLRQRGTPNPDSFDTDQNLLGTERLKLGEDPARVARQLLRKKQGNGFDRRIEYPNLGIV